MFGKNWPVFCQMISPLESWQSLYQSDTLSTKFFRRSKLQTQTFSYPRTLKINMPDDRWKYKYNIESDRSMWRRRWRWLVGVEWCSIIITWLDGSDRGVRRGEERRWEEPPVCILILVLNIEFQLWRNAGRGSIMRGRAGRASLTPDWTWLRTINISPEPELGQAGPGRADWLGDPRGQHFKLRPRVETQSWWLSPGPGCQRNIINQELGEKWELLNF